jgi:hypothetical protein
MPYSRFSHRARIAAGAFLHDRQARNFAQINVSEDAESDCGEECQNQKYNSSDEVAPTPIG